MLILYPGDDYCNIICSFAKRTRLMYSRDKIIHKQNCTLIGQVKLMVRLQVIVVKSWSCHTKCKLDKKLKCLLKVGQTLSSKSFISHLWFRFITQKEQCSHSNHSNSLVFERLGSHKSKTRNTFKTKPISREFLGYLNSLSLNSLVLICCF